MKQTGREMLRVAAIALISRTTFMPRANAFAAIPACSAHGSTVEPVQDQNVECAHFWQCQWSARARVRRVRRRSSDRRRRKLREIRGLHQPYSVIACPLRRAAAAQKIWRVNLGNM